MHSAEPDTQAPLDERYRRLWDVGRTLSAMLNPEELYTTIYRETLQVVPAERFYISMYDSKADLATVVFYVDRGEEHPCSMSYKGSDSDVIRTGASQSVAAQSETESLVLLGEEGEEQIRSSLSVPLIYGGKVRGSLSTQSYQADAYDASDLEVLERVADLAAVAIENARHVGELNRRFREAEKLEEFGRLLTSSLEYDEVLERVATAAMDLLSLDGVGVWILDGGVAKARVSIGSIPIPVGAEWDMSTGPSSILKNEPFVMADVTESQEMPDDLREHFQTGSAIGVPITVRNHPIGALTARSKQPRTFSDYDLQLLTRLAGQASVALDNAELHASIRALSMTDVLTGLPNRRHLQLHLEKEVAAARRGRRLAVVLFDLDSFKHYNDTLGHVVGDQILKAFGQVLREENRAMNLVARYGGDEFVSVLSESDEGGARGYLARVLERIKENRVLAKYGVTVSAGIARSDISKAVGFEELLQAADQHMYENKNRLGS